MLVLSGDVGGTKSRLQLTEFTDAKVFKILFTQDFLNQQYHRFSEIVELFLQAADVKAEAIAATCIAAAGPIVDGTVKFTNLPWFLSEQELQSDLSLSLVRLINDFGAIGYGIDTLKKEDIHVLQEGAFHTNAPRAMIGAGTGLGVAISVPEQGYYRVIPTEGGHADFAPTDEMQINLLTFLKKKLHRVSYERLVSGQGIVNIYNFVRNEPLLNEVENLELKHHLFQTEDVPAAISEYALLHNDAMSLRALDLFINIYGAVAGNLALMTLPFSGLYLVGGIAPKLLPQMIDGRFLHAFIDKGRMSNLLASIPVYIVLNTHVGLQGAANYGYLSACKLI